MAKDSPLFTAEWFPWYFDRIAGSDRVAMMSLTEEGAYRRAIDLFWEFGSLPANPTALAARIGKRCTEKIAQKVLEMCTPMPGNSSRVIHETVEEIRVEQEAKYESRRRGGMKTAAKRWGENTRKTAVSVDKNSSAIAQLKPTYSSPVAIERESKREIDAIASNETERLVHIGKVLAGVAAAQGIKKLSKTKERQFEEHALIAFENGFTAEQFVACYRDLREKKDYAILAEYVTDRLPDFAGRRPPKREPNKGPTARDFARMAEEQQLETVQ